MQDPFADLLPNAPSQEGFVVPVDPVKNDRAVREAETGIQNTQSTIADRNADNRRADLKLIADLEAKGYRISADGQGVERIPGWLPPADRAKPIDPMKVAQFAALEEQIRRVEELYKSNIGQTKGVFGARDYLPTGDNAAFESAAAGMAEAGLAAFRVPGVGAQSDNELRQFVAANKPSASDRDEAIEEKLRNLRNRVQITKEQLGIDLSPSEQKSAMEVARLQAIPQETQAAGFGAETTSLPIPPEMQERYNAFVASGDFTPESYAQFRADLDRQFFPDTATPQADVYKEEGARILEGLQRGGTQNLTIPRPEVGLSERDQRRNNLANVPGSAAFINAANALSLGSIDAIAPEQMQALNEANPFQALGGQIAGGIGGVTALGRVAGAGASRLAPGLLGGGEKAAFGRSLAADGGYGSLYGGITEGDPLTSGAIGVGGSAVGQALGRGVGAAIGGVSVSPAVQALKDRGVRVSVGRQLGDAGGRFEDLVQSVPVVGGRARARQQEAFADFNRAAFEEAGRPINATVSNVGAEGVEELGDQVSDAYRSALADTSIPLDQQFLDDFAAAIPSNLPSDKSRPLGQLLDARVQNIADAGQITGPNFQAAMRALKANRSKPPSAYEGFEQEFRDAVTGTMDALEGQVMRGGGADVIDGLNAANRANKNFKIIENAALDRGKVGTQASQVDMFVPSQLKTSARQSARKYGPNDLTTLANQGQEVLPSTIPNSGTTDRALAATAAGALGLGGIGLGESLYREGNPTGTMGLAGLAGALALLGTRGGQSALETALFRRPDWAVRAGQGVRRRRGMFGSGAAAPLVINN